LHLPSAKAEFFRTSNCFFSLTNLVNKISLFLRQKKNTQLGFNFERFMAWKWNRISFSGRILLHLWRNVAPNSHFADKFPCGPHDYNNNYYYRRITINGTRLRKRTYRITMTWSVVTNGDSFRGMLFSKTKKKKNNIPKSLRVV